MLERVSVFSVLTRGVKGIGFIEKGRQACMELWTLRNNVNLLFCLKSKDDREPWELLAIRKNNNVKIKKEGSWEWMERK